MQSFGAFLSGNKALAVGILIALAVLGVAVVFRTRLFGARLNMASGGRNRQPRLGVVDAFDLDRQRQLVLIRRDNVEHLILIGGPNDLLIEPAIVRAQAAAAVVPGRDKDAAATPPTLPIAPPFTGPVIAVESPTPPAVAPEAEPVPVAPQPDPPRAAQPVQTPAEPQVTPPRPTPQPVPRATPSFTPRPPGTAVPRPPGLPPRTPSALPPRPAPVIPRPSPLSRVTSAAATRRDGSPVPGAADPAGGEDAAPIAIPDPAAPPPDAAAPPVAGPVQATVEPAVARPVPQPDQPVPEPPPRPALPTTLDTLESLEEEMAKLLGRSVGDKG